MGELGALYAMWYRQVKRFYRMKSRVAASIIQPIVWMAFFGIGMSSALGRAGFFASGGVSYILFIVPGVVMMAVFFTSFMSGIAVIWDREFGFLKRVLVAPVSRASTLLGRVFGDATMATIQGMVVLAIAYLMIPLPPPSAACAAVILVSFVLAVALTSLGTAIACNMRSMEGFGLVNTLVSMPLLFLSSTFYPLSTMPTWMRAAASINPLTQAVELARALLLGSSDLPPLYSATTLLLWAVGLMGVAVWMFSRVRVEA